VTPNEAEISSAIFMDCSKTSFETFGAGAKTSEQTPFFCLVSTTGQALNSPLGFLAESWASSLWNITFSSANNSPPRAERLLGSNQSETSLEFFTTRTPLPS
jgi:hypothetical protein